MTQPIVLHARLPRPSRGARVTKTGGIPRTKHQAPGTSHQTPGTTHQAPSATAPRHQIYGDPEIVQEIEHGRTEAWLTNRVDQLLAWFAQPGKLMCPRGADLRRSVIEFEQAVYGAAGARVPSRSHSSSDGKAVVEANAVGRDARPYQAIDPADPREVRELKQMVNGLRGEMRAYLANGNGTVRSYWRRLLQRTQEEAQIYERTRLELERETDPAVFERKNQSLRNLGLRTIPNPRDRE